MEGFDTMPDVFDADMDGGEDDGGEGTDSGPMIDSGTDSGREDTGSEDTGSEDTGSEDTGSEDTGGEDTGTPDTGRPDSGPADTGTPDTGRPDTGAPDTGPADTGPCPLSDDADDWRCTYERGSPSMYKWSRVTARNTCGETVVVEECDWGSRCFQNDDYNDGFPECARSISEEAADSPFYDYGCFSFSETVMVKTNLEVDCRCRNLSEGGMGVGFANPMTMERPGNALANCQNLGALSLDTEWGVEPGSGPHFWTGYPASGAKWYGGWLDPEEREFYALVLWTNSLHRKSGSIVSYDLDTGARRVVTGIYNDRRMGPINYGSGHLSPNSVSAGPDLQPLTGANVMRVTSRETLLTLGVGTTGEGQNRSVEIVETNTATGARTLFWQSETDERHPVDADFGQCLSHQYGTSRVRESLAINSRAFAVGPDDKIYMSFRQTYDGVGIMELSADGSSCRVVGRWGARDFRLGRDPVVPAPADIGTGFTPTLSPLYGMMVHEGGVYAVNTWGDLIRFDLVTGNRILVSSDDDGFNGIGETTIVYDDTRDYIFAMGTVAPYVGAVIDPVTGRREQIFGDTSLMGTPLMTSRYDVRRSVTSPRTTTLADANYIGYGPFAIDPDDNDIAWFVMDSGALLKFEFSTFNNYIASY